MPKEYLRRYTPATLDTSQAILGLPGRSRRLQEPSGSGAASHTSPDPRSCQVPPPACPRLLTLLANCSPYAASWPFTAVTTLRAVCTRRASVCQAAASPHSAPGSLERRLGSAATTAANLFPVWLVLAAGFALWRPALLAGLSKVPHASCVHSRTLQLCSHKDFASLRQRSSPQACP